VLLRNPWVHRQSYPVTIESAENVSVHAISVYPAPRVYGESLSAGQTLEIALAPYETIVLSIAPGAVPPGIPAAQPAGNQTLAASLASPRATLRRVVYETPDQLLGDDFTSLAPASGQAIEIDADFQLDRPRSGSASVYWPIGGSSVSEASGVMEDDGQECALQSLRSDAGFFATVARSRILALPGRRPRPDRMSRCTNTEDPGTRVRLAVEDRRADPAAVSACCPHWIRLTRQCLCAAAHPLASITKGAPVRTGGED
jgi:hypothetical protein